MQQLSTRFLVYIGCISNFGTNSSTVILWEGHKIFTRHIWRGTPCVGISSSGGSGRGTRVRGRPSLWRWCPTGCTGWGRWPRRRELGRWRSSRWRSTLSGSYNNPHRMNSKTQHNTEKWSVQQWKRIYFCQLMSMFARHLIKLHFEIFHYFFFSINFY